MVFTYDLDAARRRFAADAYAALTGIAIDSITDDEVRCSLDIDLSKHCNAAGGVQGGVIFTLADLTFAVHSNLALLRGEEVCVTVGQSCSISYLKAPKGKRLTARSTRLSAGQSMSVFRVEIGDDTGRRVAEVLCNGFTTRK